MRIVFMGTPDFAVPSLDVLVRNGYEVVAVVTAPDKPSGRGLKMQASPVKLYALEKGLPILQPLNLKDPGFQAELKAYAADLQWVVAFRMLPETVWNMPTLGTYNLHASLLPAYRGAAPINWAIIKGEKETGLTTFKLQHEIDSGSILLQEKVAIGENTTAGELHDTLKEIGARLLLDSVRRIEKSFTGGEILHLKAQEPTAISHAPKLYRETCSIDWSMDQEQVHNKIRGLSPYPGAFTHYGDADGRRVLLKVLRARVGGVVAGTTNGSLLDANENGLRVACGKGSIWITEVQQEGKRSMPVRDFMRGFRFGTGVYFSG